MTKKKIPQTIEECNAELERTQKLLQQYENRNKMLNRKLSVEKRMENERLCFSVLSDYARVLRDWKVRYAPQLPDQPVHARFVEACHKLDETEYYLDILCAGDSHERAEVVRQQMSDGKLEELRQRLEEIHKEDENDNNTADVA